MLKLAILASHGGSNMQAIIDAIEAGRLPAEIAIAISNNSASGALDRARRHGLSHRHMSARTEGGEAQLDAAMCKLFDSLHVELIALAGYMRKIGPRTLERFAGRILNIHPALLPRHGGPGMYGLRPHEAALAAGDTESGATLHVVDGQYDQGPIVRQRRVPIHPGDTPQTLQQRVLAVEHELYPEVIGDIAAGRLALPLTASVLPRPE